MSTIVKVYGAVTLAFSAAFFSLCIVGFATAQNNTPSGNPHLKRYNDWVNANVKPEFTRYWRMYNGGQNREPYVVYCKEDLFAEDAIVGRVVRVLPKSAAGKFFTKITGSTAQLMAGSELNAALKLDIIDCLGFGGETLKTTGPSNDPNAFNPQAVDAVARSLGASATDKTFTWRKGVLEWSIYRATNGDLAEINNLFIQYHSHGVVAASTAFTRMSGYWGVRVFEHTKRGGQLQYDELYQAAIGNCKERVELCKGIQIELQRIGKYSGAIDGIIGPATGRAISDIAGTRKLADSAKLVSLQDFLAAREPAKPKTVIDNTNSAPIKKPTPDIAGSKPAIAPAVSLPENLDDF